jgi:hypothetical protein
MEGADDQSRTQASVPADLPSGEFDIIPPTGFRDSHGTGGGSQVSVLVELLRPLTPCARRNPRRL